MGRALPSTESRSDKQEWDRLRTFQLHVFCGTRLSAPGSYRARIILMALLFVFFYVLIFLRSQEFEVTSQKRTFAHIRANVIFFRQDYRLSVTQWRRVVLFPSSKLLVSQSGCILICNQVLTVAA